MIVRHLKNVRSKRAWVVPVLAIGVLITVLGSAALGGVLSLIGTDPRDRAIEAHTVLFDRLDEAAIDVGWAITKVDAAAGTIDAQITVSVPDTSISASYVKSTAEVLSGESSDRVLDEKALVFATGLSTTWVEIPLRTLLSGEGFVKQATIGVDLKGSFPNDRLFPRFTAGVQLPDGVQLALVRGGETTQTQNPGVLGGASFDHHFTQWTMSTRAWLETPTRTLEIRDDEVNEEGISPAVVAISHGAILSRPLTQVFFIYAVAIAPFLLFASWLIVETRSQAKRASVKRASALELAAAILALLGIRQFLVPAELSGLTFLDRLLAIELVLIVAVASSVYVLAAFHEEPPAQVLEDNGRWPSGYL